MNTYALRDGHLHESPVPAVVLSHQAERRPCSMCGDPTATIDGVVIHVGDDDPDATAYDHEPPICSMCGATSHTECEQTDDGVWTEDCEYVPFVDRDGNDRRRTR